MSIQVVREVHDTPPRIAEQLARAGGRNIFGEPMFRVIWGWNRLSWIGGKWTDHDASGNRIRQWIGLRQLPKYLPADRWHVEAWTPPEAYGSPEFWYRSTLESDDGVSVPGLGPFPRRGEYEHSFTLQTPGGEFLPLNFSAVEHIVRAIQWSRALRHAERLAALRRAAQRREQQWHATADALLDSVLSHDSSGAP